MGWSKKYKKSIDCNNPKGFSQKAHCQGRKKREHMEINELVPNMAVVNPQAYNQLLKKQLTKTKKVGTALKNKKDPLHKRALQLVKRLIKKEMLNPPNYLRNVGNVPQNNPDGEHRFKKGKDQEESIMKSDKVENMIRNLIRTEIKNIRESQMMTEEQFDEAAGKKDACYHKVKARYDVWPSAYASGALVKCRKVGAKNWGNKSKKEDVNEAKYKGYDYKRQKRKDGLSLIVPALRKTFANMKDLKKYIDKHGKMEGFSSDAQRRAAFASGYEEKGKKKKKKEGYPGISVKSLNDDDVNELTKMRPQVKKLLKQKGYNPIFGAIDNSKRQLKQMRYSRGEIQDTLISMFGDEDPKILQKIKESINEKKGDFLDSLFPKSKVDKAVKIAQSMGGDMTGAVKKIEKYFKGMSLHSKVRDALQQANESVNENNIGDKLWEACWKGYEKKGMKKMFGKMYPNCVKKTKKKESVEESYDLWMEDGSWGYTMTGIVEAEYQGRKVKLGKPMQGDSKKFKVYVKNPKGNVVKVNFGQGGDAKGGTMRIRKSNPKARANFRARHNCDSPGPRHKARYWSCRKW